MATSRSDVIEGLRYTYAKPERLRYLANEETNTWNLFKRKKVNVGGRGQFILPIIVKNPGVWKGMTEGGTLATALAPDTTEGLYSLQEFNGAYDMSWKLIQDASKSEFAFERTVAFMDKGIKRRIFRLINADVIDNGKGRLGVLPAADNATTVTVNALPSVEPGLVIDIMDLSDDDAKILDSATVTAVNVVTREVTSSGAAAGSAAGDYYVIEDTTDASLNGGVAMHLNGLLGIIDDADPATVVGDYGSIDRGTAGNEFWESIVLDNSGTNRPFTEDLALQALDGAREKGGGQVDAWIANAAIWRRYHEMLRAETFYSLSKEPGPLQGGLGRPNESQKKDGDSTGENGYTLCGVRCYTDPYFAANTIVGVDRSTFMIGTGSNELPMPLSECFEGVPFFKDATTATFSVPFYWQAEVICDNPAANVKIEDVAES